MKILGRALRWHWQNLNDKFLGNKTVTGKPTHGRAWFHLMDKDEESKEIANFSVEWAALSRQSSIGGYVAVGSGGDRDLSWSVRVPGLGLYFSFGTREIANLIGKLGIGHEDREIGVAYHDGAIRWNIWHSSMSWSSKTPWWRNGSFNFADSIFGREKYNSECVAVEEVEIPLPESSYVAKVERLESTWKRPRLPFTRRRTSFKVDIEGGIPVPGKGENSYDCGDDAIYGLSTTAASIPEAIGKVVERVIATRRRYGSGDRWPSN